MKLVQFVEANIVIAKDQPQYIPMPAHSYLDEHGMITCCWQLSFIERIKLLFSGKIWHSILTFNKPLQPQMLEVDKPRMIMIV